MKKAVVGIVIWMYVLTSTEPASINCPPDLRNTFLCDGLGNLISFINNTEFRAGAWSPTSYLSSIFNGRNGSAIIYHFWNNSGVYIPGRSSNYTWYSTRESWPHYFTNLNLTQLFNSGKKNGTIFTMSNLTREMLDEISNAVASWSPRSIQQIQNDPFASFTSISSNLTERFDEPLLSMLSMMESSVIPVSSDIFWTSEVLQGLSNFFNDMRGGLPTLLNARFVFNPFPVFNSRNGLDGLSFLLQALQNCFNLDNLLSESLNCPENCLRLVGQLGGNVCSGVTGRLVTMLEELPFETQICPGNDRSENIWCDPVEWNQSVDALYNATRNLGTGFTQLRNFIDGLRRMYAPNGELSLGRDNREG